MAYTNICKECGCEFEAASNYRRWCDKCRKKRRVVAVQRYRKKHYTVSKEPKKITPELIAKQIAQNAEFELNYRRRYCSGYDPENLNCIRCFENATAEYMGCYKK